MDTLYILIIKKGYRNNEEYTFFTTEDRKTMIRKMVDISTADVLHDVLHDDNERVEKLLQLYYDGKLVELELVFKEGRFTIQNKEEKK